jgi:hypothetical protein
METTWPRRGQAHAQSARELRVCAGHEGSCLFVPDLDKANLLLAFAQRLHDPVDAITGQSEDNLDAPFAKDVDENICRGIRHCKLPLGEWPGAPLTSGGCCDNERLSIDAWLCRQLRVDFTFSL